MIDCLPSSLLALRRIALAASVSVLIGACTPQTQPPIAYNSQVVISIIGTNDVHGQILPGPRRGGIATFSGYVEALRNVRSGSDGGVVLIDAGDMWQGTLESNLSEGATMVEAYNELGYAAAAMGNHEFDFGPVGERATPVESTDDPQGALRARATEARFPILAANLIDTNTNQLVNWPNVQPSTLIEVHGVKIGIIGVMTLDALDATIAPNVRGLRVAPLAESIIPVARELRDEGASLVIVAAHAGGSCTQFDNPFDLSSCEPDEEIMQVARALPVDLVDHIVAGHQHRGIAHVVNGIAITASFSSTRSFGRVDFVVDKLSGDIVGRDIFAPRRPCPYSNVQTGECVWEATDSNEVQVATYEGLTITPDPDVENIVARARSQAQELKDQELGVYLETPLTMEGKPESALGNLMTDAMLETSSADISLHNISGGIRADLAAGNLTFGQVYQMFPFDNRVVELDLTGAELRQIIAAQAHKEERRAGFSGMRVYVQCNDTRMTVNMIRSDGSEIGDGDTVSVVVNDFLALGGDGVLTPATPAGGFDFARDTPLARDELVSWLKERGGTLSAQAFLGPERIRWNMPETLDPDCSL